MARGDPVYAKVDCSIRHGEKYTALKPEHRAVYISLWLLAVEVRSDVLLRRRYSSRHLSHECEVGTKQLHAAIASMERVGLITQNKYGDITVIGVVDCHNKLRWDKRPIQAPYGENQIPHTGPKLSTFRDSESKRVREISTDPDTEIVTQSPGKLEPRPTGAVDVKNLLREAEEESDRKRAEAAGGNGGSPDDLEPWNQSTTESELELEVHRWFLGLWSGGEYDWEAEKDSVLSQVRIYRRGSYNIARAILLEHRREGKFIPNELAYLNGIARKQWEKSRERG